MSEEQQVSGEEEMQDAAAPEVVEETQESGQDRQVPLTALESERAKRQHLEEENRLMKEHFNLMQSNQSQPQSQPKDEFGGLDDGDVMTVADFKKLSSQMSQEFRMTLGELKMTQKNPDYQEVISKYLPEVLNQNPSLKTTLKNTQDYELAYHLAKNSEAYRSQNKKTKRNEDAERIIRNSQQAGYIIKYGRVYSSEPS